MTKKEVRDLIKRAKQGEAEAQYKLGLCYYKGDVVKSSLVRAFKYFDLAAEQGHADAMVKVGDFYSNNECVCMDMAQAATYYKKAADLGNAEAQYNIGAFYRNGTGVKMDLGKSLNYFNLAAKQGDEEAKDRVKEVTDLIKLSQLAERGDVEAQVKFGHMCLVGEDVDEDFSKVLKYLEAMAGHGSAEDLYKIGKHYEDGEGVSEDIVQAVKYFKLAADKGDAHAQNELGDCYFEGNGVERDLKKALRYYKLAAKQGSSLERSERIEEVELLIQLAPLLDQGDVDAQYKLAAFYRENGDDAEAEHYLKLAADQGHGCAQYELGQMYLEDRYGYFSRFVEGHLQEATKYLKLAAEQGHAEAQNAMGELYANGKGVRKNRTLAIKYFTLAADQGNEDAQKYLAKAAREANAATLKKRAAQGDADAQFELWLHFKETGESEKAMHFLTLAADAGNKKAQYRLGLIYRYDDKDFVKALHYLKLAKAQKTNEAIASWFEFMAENGVKSAAGLERLIKQADADDGKVSAKACRTLADIFCHYFDREYEYNERDDEDDLERGKVYLERCADNGDTEAMCELGDLLNEEGENDEAVEYIRRARELGSDTAEEMWDGWASLYDSDTSDEDEDDYDDDDDEDDNEA